MINKNSFAAVNVPLAVLWSEPGDKREYDRLILGASTAPAAWADGMDDEMRLWLVGKVDTQVLYGERLLILDRQGDWLKVIALEQATSQDRRGYPGWLPAAQVSASDTFLLEQADLPLAAVSAATTGIYGSPAPHALIGTASYQTRLPLLHADEAFFMVRLPDGGTGYLSLQDAAVGGQAGFSGVRLVAEARKFLDLRYIWGGTSAYGFDCSGFAMRLYQSQGVAIPRDADDQAHEGLPVSREELAPGDLLFFAGKGGQGSIHHVGVYAGGGLMIHAPNSRSAVREEAFSAGVYGEEYWGARRYRQ